MLNECIAAFGNHGGQRLLVKNRDKSYKPKLDFYHEIRNDTEMLYYIDELVNHLEGMNEHGVGIIYTTSIFQDDTVDRLTDNVYMVLKALESKTAKGAIDPLVNLRGGVHGLIFVSGDDGTYLVEHDSNLDTAKARKIEAPNSWEVITNSPTMLESGIDPAAGETYVSCQIRKALAEAALYGITDIEEALSALAYKYFDEDSHHNMLRTSDFETTCAQLGMDLNNKKCYVTPVPGAVDSYKLVNKLPSGYDSKIDLVERSFTEPTVAPFKIFTRKIDEGVQKFNLVNYLIDDGPESDTAKLDDKYSKHFKDNTDLELAQKAAEAMWEKEKILLSLRRKLESDPIFFTAGQTSNQVQKEIGLLDSMIDRCTADWEKLVDYIYYERFGEPRPQLEEAKKRRPRKKGQRRNSSKHDDLYTNENPRGDIKGLGFKDPATARKGIAIVNKAKRTHAHKVQATLVMVQRGKVAIKRTKDPEKKKNLKAANKLWSAHLEKLKKKTKKMNESNLRMFIREVLSDTSPVVSEALEYHLKNQVPVTNNVYRPGSDAYFSLIREARSLAQSGDYEPAGIEAYFLYETDVGEFGEYHGELVPLDFPMLNEAEYQGKKVELNSPKRSSGPTKYKVFTKNKKGNVIKVDFGDQKGGLSAKLDDDEAVSNFVSRHNCKSAKKKDKTKAGYWSCRLPRYWKELGFKKNSRRFW
jgi:hypothetical protein